MYGPPRFAIAVTTAAEMRYFNCGYKISRPSLQPSA
jgi:hypothetical protein